MIKELIQEYVEPHANDFFAVCFEQKRFIAQKSKEESDSVVEPLSFFVCCMMVISVFFALTFGIDFTNVSSSTTMLTICLALLVTTCVQVCWGCLGGKLSARAFFRMYLYISGVGTIFLVLPTFVALKIILLLELGPTYSVVAPLLTFFGFNLFVSIWSSPAREWFRQNQGLAGWRRVLAEGLSVLFLFTLQTAVMSLGFVVAIS